MEQLDICKEQEKRILQLTQENEELRDTLQQSPTAQDNLAEQMDALKSRLRAAESDRNRLREELQFLAQKYTELEEARVEQRYTRFVSEDRN